MNAQLQMPESIDCGLADLALREPARVTGLVAGDDPADAELCLRLAELGFAEWGARTPLPRSHELVTS